MSTSIFSKALPVALSYIAVGIPCGIMSAAAGMSALQAALMSAVIFTGAGQMMLNNLMLAAATPFTLVASVAAISSRFALYGTSMAHELIARKEPLAKSLVACACLTEEAFGISITMLEQDSKWGAAETIKLSVALIATWSLANFIGAAVGSSLNMDISIAAFAMTTLFVYLLSAQMAGVMRSLALRRMLAAGVSMLSLMCLRLLGVGSMSVLIAALLGIIAALILDVFAGESI